MPASVRNDPSRRFALLAGRKADPVFGAVRIPPAYIFWKLHI